MHRFPTSAVIYSIILILFWRRIYFLFFLYRFSYAWLHGISTDYEFLINFDWFQLQVLLHLVIYNSLDLAFSKILLRVLKKTGFIIYWLQIFSIKLPNGRTPERIIAGIKYPICNVKVLLPQSEYENQNMNTPLFCGNTCWTTTECEVIEATVSWTYHRGTINISASWQSWYRPVDIMTSV